MHQGLPEAQRPIVRIKITVIHGARMTARCAGPGDKISDGSALTAKDVAGARGIFSTQPRPWVVIPSGTVTGICADPR